jgi:squalene synthase HpnC
MSAAATADVAGLASGKGHTDENFPVASVLIAPRHRPAVLAFYRFARAADDVSDSPTAAPETKLALLETMRATLAGESDENPESLALRRIQEACGIDGQHGLDLLEAFRRDVTKLRYADWGELMDYCRYSAAPVGRFVLDVHGESRTTWPANDALCAALQVINHLQDCAKDYRDLDRCYLPLDMLAAAGVSVDDMSAPAASPGLRRVIADLARQTDGLLAQSETFSGQIRDMRLGLEVSVIQRLAEDLNWGLMRRDPLSEKVHHNKLQMLGLALAAAAGFTLHRLGLSKPLSAKR